MRATGISAEFIYGYKKTGYVLLSDRWQKLPEGVEEWWHAATRVYLELENEAACGVSNRRLARRSLIIAAN